MYMLQLQKKKKKKWCSNFSMGAWPMVHKFKMEKKNDHSNFTECMRFPSDLQWEHGQWLAKKKKKKIHTPISQHAFVTSCAALSGNGACLLLAKLMEFCGWAN